MNKIILIVKYFFLISFTCYSAEISLKKFEPDRVIETGVENLLIIQNNYTLHQCIDISKLRINKVGNIIMKQDSVLQLSSSLNDSGRVPLDPDQGYVVQEFFKASKSIIIFSYARKSGLKTNDVQYHYCILNKIVNEWQLEAFGIEKVQIQDALLNIKKSQ